MIVSKECAERGCAGHDPRVDGPGVEVSGMSLRQAAQQALEALRNLQGGCTDHDDGTVEAITVWCPEVIKALEQALAEPEQECDIDPRGCWSVRCQLGKKCKNAPAPRKPVELSDEELNDLYRAHHTEYGECVKPGFEYERTILAAYKAKRGQHD